MASTYTIYGLTDIVSAITNNYTKAQEDYIISNSFGLATVSGTYTTSSGEEEYVTISGITVTGTNISGSWDYTVTSGSADEVVTWRLANYLDVYTTAQKSMKKRVYYDNTTTVSGRSDMTAWNNLLDDDVNSGVDYTISGTIYVELEKPTAQWTTAVRCRVDTTSYGFFAASSNDTDWTYYSTTSGTNLSIYSTLSGAEANYTTIPAGNNIYILPDGLDIAYNRLYLTTTGTNYSTTLIDFDFTNAITADDIVAGTIDTDLVQISSADGKIVIAGNTLIVYDVDDNVKVKLGYLG